jgi:spore coat polysaccharide biosynthesis protein SpsF
MKNLSGRPVLWHVLDRCKRASSIDSIVVATTTNTEDDELASYVESLGGNIFRGSSDDVLQRFADAAQKFGGTHIVRITSDCPLVDPHVLDLVVDGIGNHSYATNVFDRTFPRGLDVEIFTSVALFQAAKEASTSYDHEHVTPYIREHEGLFPAVNISMPSEYHAPDLRFTLDTPEDFQLLTALYTALYHEGSIISVPEAISYVREHPELAKLNASVAQKPDPKR